jgi:hypothetical protein
VVGVGVVGAAVVGGDVVAWSHTHPGGTQRPLQRLHPHGQHSGSPRALVPTSQ